MAVRQIGRPTLDALDLPVGKRVRLRRLLDEYGPGGGTMMVLPTDQGLEHGPADFAPNPPSADPEFQFRLAVDGGYSAVAFHYGIASKYLARYAGRIPLILKVNGKTNIPPDDAPLSGPTATVDDAVALGADAVGYTLYVGSPRQDEDFRQLTRVRRACVRCGMPLVVWAYPRGTAVEAAGGRDSLYAVDYAARVAMELGADVVKLNLPRLDADGRAHAPKPYDAMALSLRDAVAKVVQSAGRALVLFSGGSRVGDDELVARVRTIMQGGATGVIFGRNMWQRPMAEALAITARVREILREFAV